MANDLHPHQSVKQSSKRIYGKTVSGQEIEKLDTSVRFLCKSKDKMKWAKLWGTDDRDFSRRIRQILNTEADKQLNIK